MKRLDKATPFIMLLPALIGIGFVFVYPTLDAFRMSFFDIQLLKPDRPFIFLQNYINMLKNPDIWRIIANTVIFSICSLFLGAVLAMVIATELNKKYFGRTFFRALFLAPWVTPPLVTAMVWRLLLSESFSPINALLMNLNIISTPINFLGSTETFLGVFSVPMLSIIMINTWSIFPFMMVMFLAGLQTIPQELYEAARVDGASKWQQFKSVTLPCLFPVIETSILLEGVWQFNNFNISYLVARGGPLRLTEVMAVSVYNEAFTNFKYGSGAALSIIMFLIVLAPSIWYIKKVVRSNT